MLKFHEPIFYGRLIKRYKRFFMDVILDDNTTVTAHTPNTGSMLGLLDGAHRVMVTKNDNPKRVCTYTTQAIEIDGAWVGINTIAPNQLIKASLSHPLLADVSHYQNFKAEMTYGRTLCSRVDFYFSNSSTDAPPLYLEIKNVTLRVGDQALFPDAVSTRAQKHLDDLLHAQSKGFHAALWFIIQRQDCQTFAAAKAIDPTYAKKLSEAQRAGLRVRALAARIDEHGLALTHEVPCIL
jgi:sugar fermentation stimulation protein A